MNVLRQLFSPLKYFAASNSAKRIIDWAIPALGTAVLMLVAYLLPESVQLLGDGGLVQGVGNILQDLVGFYIAALAAISTFNVKSLDQLIAGDEPVVLRDTEGNTGRITRRQLLSLMFSYLSMASLLLYLVGLGAQALEPNLKHLQEAVWLPFAVGSAKAIYAFLLLQLLCVTLLGLHYLGNRLLRQDPVALPEKPPLDPDPNSPVHADHDDAGSDAR